MLFIVTSFLFLLILSAARPIVLITCVIFLFAYFLKIWSLAVYSSLFVLASIYGLSSIIHLGIRPSLLYRRSDDPLVTTGPYALVRHPQLFAGLAMAFAASWMRGSSWGLFNCIIFSFSYMALIWYEENDLEHSFPFSYFQYSKAVPRLFPTFKRIRFLLSRGVSGTRADEGVQSIYSGPHEEKSIIEIAMVVIIIGIVAAIAIPDFLRFQARAGMSIAKNDLRRIYRFQRKYHGIFHTYYTGEHRWINTQLPSDSNSYYTWFITDDYILPAQYGWIDRNTPYDITWKMLSEALHKEGRPDLLPYSDQHSFISVIATNLDSDSCLDIWYVNEKEEILNLVNDREVPCKWDFE